MLIDKCTKSYWNTQTCGEKILFTHSYIETYKITQVKDTQFLFQIL